MKINPLYTHNDKNDKFHGQVVSNGQTYDVYTHECDIIGVEVIARGCHTALDNALSFGLYSLPLWYLQKHQAPCDPLRRAFALVANGA